VRAARGEADDDVAGGDGAAVDRLGFLDNADGESGEIIFAWGERARMLSRFAADQRASGDLAAARDAFDHFGGHVDLEPLAHVIIEEEKRLRALNQNIVDAHCHQVDADRVVLAEREGQFKLGANAIGSGDQDRLAKALGQLDQCAKAADACQHFGSQRSLGVGLDVLHQPVTGVDVDAGLEIRQGAA